MKINDILNEKRKNPEQNPKENIYDFILKYADGDYFLHTSGVAKVGINPKTAKRTSDDTPAGIYTFHIKSIVPYLERGKEYNKSLGWSLPFYGGNELFILKPTEPVIDMVSDYSHDDLQKDVAKLKEKFDPELVDKMLSIAHTNENFINAPVGYLWGMTKGIAIGGTSELSHTQYPDPMKWNSILRYLGYHAFLDRGHGWIHAAESTQALFLDSTSFEVIDHTQVHRSQETITIGNKEYRGGRLPKQIYLNGISDTELSNISRNKETEKVKSVTVETSRRLNGMGALRRIFPNAEIRIEKLILDNIRTIMTPPQSDALEYVKVDRLIFSEEFPVLPSHIEMLEKIKNIPNSIEYTPPSIDNYGRVVPPAEEKYSPELFKKIKAYH